MAPNIPIIIKSLFFILILLNIRSFPLAYHVQTLPSIFKIIKKRNDDNKEGKKKDLFHTTEYKSIVLFDDLDSNLHMNNSSYNKLLDYARGQFLAESFANVLWDRSPSILQKSVLTIFNLEIPPFSRYSVHTRILTWDPKWCFLVSYFRLHSNNKITSLGISRFVFKEQNGKTIKPEEIFEAAGYFKNESEEEKEERENRRQKGMKIAEGMNSLERLFDEDFVGDLNLKNNITKVPAKL
ncbi:hypothetical protein C1645_788276 [Glomus cerebriforme]|uniref:HotDog domain-containing protein n=1 Tax=Glomus cerebriforme TaxID=658196 RepID=A0A397SIW5_9GLOM|nr:hypothetical protein C1645_788276 [Glomus cerebriforme]